MYIISIYDVICKNLSYGGIRIVDQTPCVMQYLSLMDMYSEQFYLPLQC